MGRNCRQTKNIAPIAVAAYPRVAVRRKKKKEEYRSAGKLLQRVSTAFLALGIVGAVCVAVGHHMSLDEWHKNVLLSIGLGLGVFASCVFPASVCYGLGKLVDAKADL